MNYFRVILRVSCVLVLCGVLMVAAVSPQFLITLLRLELFGRVDKVQCHQMKLLDLDRVEVVLQVADSQLSFVARWVSEHLMDGLSPTITFKQEGEKRIFEFHFFLWGVCPPSERASQTVVDGPVPVEVWHNIEVPLFEPSIKLIGYGLIMIFVLSPWPIGLGAVLFFIGTLIWLFWLLIGLVNGGSGEFSLQRV